MKALVNEQMPLVELVYYNNDYIKKIKKAYHDNMNKQ